MLSACLVEYVPRVENKGTTYIVPKSPSIVLIAMAIVPENRAENRACSLRIRAIYLNKGCVLAYVADYTQIYSFRF